MVLWNLIFPAQVIKHPFSAAGLPPHDQPASEEGAPLEPGKEFFPFTTFRPPLWLLIPVTFSTPTGDYTNDLSLWPSPPSFAYFPGAS